jgi:hypothetical protein
MAAEPLCEELEQPKDEASSAVLEATSVRSSSDVSDEDAEPEGYRRVCALIKCLLVGHDGNACPGGNPPIVRFIPKRRRGYTEDRSANRPVCDPGLERQAM